MNGLAMSSTGTEDQEIGRLIALLHDTGQRLAVLTQGEVDGVSDRQGHTFLLRDAQDQLRHAEAARKAAILNALPAHIALLDSQGRILSVNRAWRKFADANRFIGAGHGVGIDYLAICDLAGGVDGAEAAQAGSGIRSVLAGKADSFSLKYPCHSPAEQRWFLLTVMPLGDRKPHGAVVMHLNVTKQKHDEEGMLSFASAMDATADAIYLVDRAAMRFVHVNSTACQMQGLTRKALLAITPAQLLGVPQAELERMYDAVIAGDAQAGPQELQRQRPGGSRAWVELRRHAHRAGGRWMIVTMVRDVTERHIAQERIAYLSRMHAMLSGINMLIVRVRDSEELFAEACRIAVDDGGFRIAWIGTVIPGTMDLALAAATGMGEPLLTIIQASLSSSGQRDPPVDHMALQAIREKKAIVLNDLRRDARPGFGKAHAETGILSMALFPLIVADDVVGVLVLGANEVDFFHPEELRLLAELAGDIAFAIDHLGKQTRLDYLAYYDALTGLANRTLFLDRLAQHMRGAASAGHKLALFLLDLDRFRYINDSLGRPAGDSLLRQVAQWMTARSGDVNLLARVGADQFAVVVPQVRPDGDLSRLIEGTAKSLLAHPFRLNDAMFRVAVKAGAAVFPDDGADAEKLFRHAEAALKKAKTSGERYLFYAPAMTQAVAGQLTLENQLRLALDRGEFVLHYQPKVVLVSGKLNGVEALIRWNDPRTGLVPPGLFIPVLEETGLIHEVGRWALRQAIADHLRWRATGLGVVRIAVNVSPLQLRHRGFVAEIGELLGVDADAAAGLELEITESLIMEDVQHSIATLKAIRDMAVTVAIDDFGTGFSSLSYLARLPVDTLKIDRSFIIDMTSGPQGLALVSTIIGLAHALQLKVVAEGVETEEQSRLLRLLSCDDMQGYLFSKPVASDLLEKRFLVAGLAAPGADDRSSQEPGS